MSVDLSSAGIPASVPQTLHLEVGTQGNGLVDTNRSIQISAFDAFVRVSFFIDVTELGAPPGTVEIADARSLVSAPLILGTTSFSSLFLVPANSSLSMTISFPSKDANYSFSFSVEQM